MIELARVLCIQALHRIDRPMAIALAYGASLLKADVLQRIDEEGCGAAMAAAAYGQPAPDRMNLHMDPA